MYMALLLSFIFVVPFFFFNLKKAGLPEIQVHFFVQDFHELCFDYTSFHLVLLACILQLITLTLHYEVPSFRRESVQPKTVYVLRGHG